MNLKLISVRSEGIPQDTVLEDEERMTKIQELVDKLRAGYHTESIIAELRKRGKIQQIQRRIESYNSSVGKY